MSAKRLRGGPGPADPTTADQIESIYRELIEGTDAVTWVSSGDEYDASVYISPQVERLLGYPPERWKTPGFWLTTVHPDDAVRVQAMASATLDPDDFEYRVITADGRTLWFLERIRSVHDAQGRRLRRLGVTIDITERKEREAAVREAEARYRHLIESQDAWFWEEQAEPVARVAYLSPQFERLTGYPAERFIGPAGPFGRIIHPDDRERVAAGVVRFDEGRLEYRIIRADGRTIWIREQAVVQRDAAGRPIGRLGIALDVTAEHEAREALREAAVRLAGAFDALSDPILIVSAIRDAGGAIVDTRIDYANPAWRRLLPESLASIDPIGRPFAATYTHLADRLANHRRVIETGEPYRTTMLVPGTDRLMDIQYVKYGDGVIGTSREVTEARQAALEVARAEERFELATSVASFGIFEWDHRTGEVYWSPSLRTIHGVSPDAEASLSGLVGFVHPEDRARVVALATSGIGPGGSGRYTDTYRVVRPDGSIRWVSVQARTFSGSDGVAERTLGVHHDVTQRETAVERLRLGEERYRALLNELDAVVTEHDEISRESFVSPQAAVVFGYPPEKMVEPGFWRSLVVPEDRERVHSTWDRMLRTSAAPLADYELEYRVRHADGRIVWLTERSHAISDASGLPLRWYGVVVDVTEPRRLAEAMARTSRLEAISRLATTTAHDFGNILLGISMFRSMLAESLPPDDPRQRYVRQIEAAVERGGAVSEQLMAFGRDRAAASGPVDVDELLGNLAPMLERVGAGRAELVIEPTRCHILGDRGSLEQAVLNLVLNATDAMPEGGTIRISGQPVEIARDTGLGIRPGRYARLSVTDDGIGMSPDVLERALEPFFTTKVDGTGIGLSSVYGAVREAGGAIQLESELGHGTTVHLILPMAPERRPRRTRGDPGGSPAPSR